jgi:hypothetical protein
MASLTQESGPCRVRIAVGPPSGSACALHPDVLRNRACHFRLAPADPRNFAILLLFKAVRMGVDT